MAHFEILSCQNFHSPITPNNHVKTRKYQSHINYKPAPSHILHTSRPDQSVLSTNSTMAQYKPVLVKAVEAPSATTHEILWLSCSSGCYGSQADAGKGGILVNNTWKWSDFTGFRKSGIYGKIRPVKSVRIMLFNWGLAGWVCNTSSSMLVGEDGADCMVSSLLHCWGCWCSDQYITGTRADAGDILHQPTSTDSH